MPIPQRYIRLLTFLLPLIICACSKNEFRLTFSLPEEVTANYTAVYYATAKDGGVSVETVVNISSGKGALTCATRLPTLLYLYAGGNIPTVIYAERGKEISVTGSSKDAASWEIKGSGDINTDLSLWRNAHAPTLTSGTPLEINEAVADFVVSNPSNPVSAILLLTAFSRREEETKFRRLWNSLTPEADKEKWVAMVGRSDMTDPFANTPGRLISMALRSLRGGADTIRPAGHSATLLFFWNNGLEGRDSLIDSIRSLSKEFPDSASRIIADISLDPDSLGWRTPLRNDSLEKVTRLWIPAGLADRRLIDLGVARIPFFIVAGPDGHQAYRGSDVREALSSFRRIAAD